MPYAQAHTVNYESGTVLLYSYTTLVARLSSDGWLVVYGLFSATTRKHISAFMREYAKPLSYYDAKRSYVDDVRINIYTGEVEDL